MPTMAQMLPSFTNCGPIHQKGAANEPIREVITCFMACQYHIVWVPKYRYRVLSGKIGYEVDRSIRQQVDRLGCRLVELNIQKDHVHLLIKVPP